MFTEKQYSTGAYTVDKERAVPVYRKDEALAAGTGMTREEKMKKSQIREFLDLLPGLENTKSSGKIYIENLPKIREKLRAKGIEVVYQEMEMDDKYLDMQEDTSYAKDSVSLHSHTFYEILLCEGGNLQYLLGNRRYQIQKNDIVVIPPGVSHRPLFLEGLKEPYQRLVLWVNAEFMQKCKESLRDTEETAGKILDDPNYVIRLKGNILYEIKQLLRLLYTEKKEDRPGNDLFCIGGFYQFYSLLYRGAVYSTMENPKPEEKELFDEILSYVEEHLAEKISLKGVAVKFLISQSAVSHLFKKYMDLSFYRVVTQRRLIEAKNLISEGTTLKEIPERCGFSDYSLFYKSFVKEYGISPREYKVYFAEKRET